MSQYGEFRQGYPTLIAAFIGLGLGVSGVPLYTFGYFVLPLMERYDLSRTEVSAWVSAYTATVLVAAPLVGRLVDRFGGRAVACISFIALAGAYAYCAAADTGRLVLYSTAVAVAILGSGSYAQIWCMS